MIARRGLQSSRHLQIRSYSSSTLYLRAYHVGAKRSAVDSSRIRTYSTSPSSDAKTSTTPSPNSPLPQSAVSRKKIDLHPSPRKVDSTTLKPPGGTPKPPLSTVESPRNALQNPPTAVAEKAAESSTTSSISPSPESEHASIIQLAIEDMRKAQQHGIIPPPPEGANQIRRWIHQGKELFKFYFRGLKLIVVHRRTVKDIEARLRAEQAAGRSARPTRWESQFIRTYKQDLVKLVPFLMVVIIAEELIPLLVMYAPGLLPSTCVLPSQAERIQDKAEAKRKEAFASLKAISRSVDGTQAITSLNDLSSDTLKQICRIFGYSPWGPLALARRRVRRHLDYLAIDDELLASECRGSRLSHAEVKAALWDRGFVLDGVDEASLKPTLASWVDAASDEGRRLSLVVDRAATS